MRASQQKRLFNILDRATTKFKSDINLWAQYLHYCREQAALKRGQKVLSRCLRLFPTRPEVWGYAAGWAEGTGDLSGARGYYLRGLRFCGGDTHDGKELYLRFARAEMRWIRAQKDTLGLESKPSIQQGGTDNRNPETNETRQQEIADAELITSQNLAESHEHKQAEVAAPNDSSDFKHFSSTPAMSGAIPIAIFDQAMKAYHKSQDLAESFFKMFVQFPDLACTRRILQHVISNMANERAGDYVRMQSYRCQMPLIGTNVDSPEFPAALRLSLAEIDSSFAKVTDDRTKSEFAARLLDWIAPLAADEKLVPELRTVFDATTRRLAQTQALISLDQ